MTHRRGRALLAAVLLAAACGGEADSGPTVSAGGGGSGGGEPGPSCAPGERPLGDGSCQPAGVPPEACAPGFEPTADRGCAAVLPADPCPAGQMAAIGETACREIAPCGDGTWGQIPVDGSTVYVDQAYAGGSEDGSAARPFVTIGEAVQAAAPGSLIAIAAGSYVENLLVQGKALRFWGRCPSMVEVVGTDAGLGAFDIRREGAAGTEIRSLAIRGSQFGVLLTTVPDAVLDQLWIHDLGEMGLEVADSFGPSNATLSNSLVERTNTMAAFAFGSALLVESSVIRDTQMASSTGWAIGAYDSADSGRRAEVTVRASLLERNVDVGVFVTGSDLVMEGSVVRQTEAGPGGLNGFGLWVEQHAATTRARSTARISGSVLERNRGASILVQAADLLLDTTVVRDTLVSEDNGAVGRALGLESDPETTERANAIVRASVLADSEDSGVHLSGSDLVLESAIIRNTRPGGFDNGMGLWLSPSATNVAGPPRASVRWSVLERNHVLGVFVTGAELTVEGSVVRDTLPRVGTGEAGRGIGLQDTPDGWRSTLHLLDSRIEHSVEIGLFIGGSDALVERSAIRDTASRADGVAGDGLVILAGHTPAQVVLRGARIADSHRAGIANFGAAVVLEGSVLECNAISLNGEAFDGTGQPAPFSFDDLGGNRCGCGELDEDCAVQSAALEPPLPIGG